MSIINPRLWENFISVIPCPENCTYEQFYLARDQIWAEEHTKWVADYAKNQLAVAQRFKDYPDIVVRCKENIEVWTDRG